MVAHRLLSDCQRGTFIRGGLSWSLHTGRAPLFQPASDHAMSEAVLGFYGVGLTESAIVVLLLISGYLAVRIMRDK